MDNRKVELSKYRIEQAEETLQVAKECYQGKHYKDSINRSYYAAFYAIKAVLALDTVDFKRHKDVIAYFNKTYVAGGKFPKELGKGLGHIQKKREKSDYDDFYIATAEEASEQIHVAETTISEVIAYIANIK